ncbi:hypothetical protein SERLA73DRAFT_166306 [Serpula lacrymans var. lacrymans S7.3]|uniref:Chromo domain-containing protein n=1 Tax=Serpula lacrymans var. lacrymans (strain S7.3) TaxID=936435 RepID=F8PNR4_SERL3|nr:hypothetical protein SERLA73DRAFT_166306 [Serpula lacrymans var. lacrymans S7.3]
MGHKRQISDRFTPSSKRLKSNSTIYLSFEESPPPSVTIKGLTFTPTKVFDTFWRYAAERQAIDDRRRKGLPPPWTDDPILGGYRFCNVFRVLDRVSQYIIREVIEIGPQEPTEVVFRVVLFNTFTRIETYQLLRSNFGTPTWAQYKRRSYEKVLRAAYENGVKLYTDQLANAHYMADIFDWLCSFKSMGDFTAYQLLLNLSYSDVINFSEDDFVSVGIGARRGLRDCFEGSLSRSVEVDIIRWMQQTQQDHFARLGLDFRGLSPDQCSMQLCDVEHTLCEVYKYIRLCRRGTSNKTFQISAKLAARRLPKAWSHPDRQMLRIRTEESTEIVEKFTVSQISAHRMINGGREFLVYWEGYSDDDATWEPEDMLMEDAPIAVKDYLTDAKIKR